MDGNKTPCDLQPGRVGKALQRRAEAEAFLKYEAGMALLREMESQDSGQGEGVCAR